MIKKFLLIISYWFFLLYVPLKFIFPFLIKDGGWLILYLIIFPFLFFIFYKLAELKNKKEKFLYVVLGFLIPLCITYIYFYFDFQKSLKPGL